MNNHVAIFTSLYEQREWGDGSGQGSTIDFNEEEYIPFLRNYINEKRIKSIVDIGCGDWQCGPALYFGLPTLVSYTGYDAYEGVIKNNQNRYGNECFKFIHTDIQTTALQDAELCILKDVLQHWTNKEITTVMDRLVQQYPRILICNCATGSNNDLAQTGQWRPLTCKLPPLSKYNPKVVLYYRTKEVALIQQ